MRLSENEARRRFGRARVMRLATVRPDGAPHLVVATFTLLDQPARPDGSPGTPETPETPSRPDAVVTAVDHKPKTTTRLARLRNIAADPRVSILVDQYDDRDWSLLWWVRADGRGEEIAEKPDRTDAVRQLAAKYPQYAAEPPAGPVIRIEVHRWRGWAASHQSGVL